MVIGADEAPIKSGSVVDGMFLDDFDTDFFSAGCGAAFFDETYSAPSAATPPIIKHITNNLGSDVCIDISIAARTIAVLHKVAPVCAVRVYKFQVDQARYAALYVRTLCQQLCYCSV